VYKTAEDVAVGKFQLAQLGLPLKDGALAETAADLVVAKAVIEAVVLANMLKRR